MKNNLLKKMLKIFMVLLMVVVVVSYPIYVNASSSGPNSPGTVADDATVGSATWSNPSNSQSSNNVYATAVISDLGSSHYLKASNFGFSLPSSTINGIVVEIERKADNPFNIAKDADVKIVKADGTIGTTDKASTTQYPSTDTYASYGSSSDLWGETWSYTDINDVDFGVVLSSYVSFADTLPTTTTVYVDHIRITVYYTLGLYPTITTPTQTSITSSGATLGGNVTSDGGATITGRGVCVGTSANPAIGGTCFSTSGTTGVFTVDATNLSQNTLYHYRAYATNANGTSYTTDDTFTTLVAECTSSSTGDRFTLNGSCSFSGVLLDGIDANGTNSTNSAILTITSGVTLTVPAQQTLATGIIDLKGGGSIVVIKNGKIKLKTPLYLTDSDSDGYPASTSAILVPNAADKRKYTITSLTSTDCKDSGTNANLVYISKTCYIDNDVDGYTNGSKTCTNNSTCSSATYASTGSANDVVNYPTTNQLRASASGTNDANDSQKCADADTPSTSGSAIYNTTCNKCVNGGLSNQTNAEDLFAQCSATGTVVRLNSDVDTTSCNSKCSSYTHTEALCSGTGSTCATHTGSCVDVGYDDNGTNNLGVVFYGSLCHTGAGNCASTTAYTASQSCLGHNTPWINCRCQ